MSFAIQVNANTHSVDVDGDTPFGCCGSAEVTPEDGQQPLHSAEDWWAIVLGSGYRWTVEQMSDGERARVKATNLKTLRDSSTKSVETNVIYAVAQKI